MRPARRGRISRAGALYGVLLRAYPPEFRERYARDAIATFERIHGDAAVRGRRAVLGLWSRTIGTVIADGLRERLRSGVPCRTWSDAVTVDARVSLRSLWRHPGFAVTTVLLLALGIGATATMFSIVDGVLLRPLPYPAAERLVEIDKAGSNVPVPDFDAFRERSRSFDAIGGVWNVSLDIVGDADAERVGGAFVVGDFFELFGARAMRGRLFTDEDVRPGAPRVAVIGSGLWIRRWHANPDVVGSTRIIGGLPTTIVGILDFSFVPPEALGVDATGLYVPFDPTTRTATEPTYYVLSVAARLNSAATVETARSDLEAVAAGLADEFPRAWRDRTGAVQAVRLQTLRSATVSGIGRTLWLFLGAVALMLLIACVNVANLFLARATERDHEMALRSALGAGRRRIIRQALTESLVLATVGGLAGCLVAVGGLRAIIALDPAGIPRLAEVAIDFRVVAFAAAVSGLTGIFFGLVPAIGADRSDASAVLREGGRAATVGRSRLQLRNALLVAEIAVALILLAGAGLLMSSFLRLQRVDPGFEATAVLTFGVDTESRLQPSEHRRFADDLLARVRRIPGVTHVGGSWRLPFGRGRCCWNEFAWTIGGTDTILPYIHPVAGDYFQALGVPVVEGRSFNTGDADAGEIPDGDGPAAPRIPAIISRTIAERFWPGRSAPGLEFQFGRMNPTTLDVVGVAEDIRHWRLDTEPGTHVYVPYESVAAWGMGLFDVAIRYTGPEKGIREAVRSIVRDIDDALPIASMASMDERIARSIATPRFYMFLFLVFAALAFVLAAGGVYGSMLYVVGMRRRELGIRFALGAARRDVVRHVIGAGALIVGIGAILGVAGALAVTRLLRGLVFGVSVTDPWTLIGAVILLASAGLIACWIPAHKAAREDPVAVLRSG